MNGMIYRVLCGFLIGVGCILPGVSGGVMAVSFGLYQPMLAALTHPFAQWRKHLKLLLPVGIGGMIGMGMGAEGLAYAMNRWEVPMLFLFLGFVVGGIPGILRDVRKHPFRWQTLGALLPGGLLLAAMLLMGDKPQAPLLTPLQWVLAGGIYALGTVIPGLSSSFLLIQLGWYQQVLLCFSRLRLPDGLLFGAGFLLVTLACLHGVKALFDRWPDGAAMGVVGLLIASVVPAIPGLEAGGRIWVDLAMLAAGLVVSLALERLGNKLDSPL